MTSLAEVAPTAIGAVAGGGGVAWMAKLLITRMIAQYDEQIKTLTERLTAAAHHIVVLQTNMTEVRERRLEIETRLGQLRGELETKLGTSLDEVESLRIDIWIAHERVRMLAVGNSDFSKIEAPKAIKRR